MKRIAIMIAAAAMLAACGQQPKAQGPVKKDMALQLYSIRNVIGDAEKYAANHESVFKALAEMVYTAAEAANYNGDEGLLYGVKPEQYKADLEAAGLKSLSSHIGHSLSQEELKTGKFDESMKWWDKAIAVHKAAGCSYIVTPSFPVPDNLKDLKTYCDYFNAIGKKCAEAGIKYGYHNHAHEFNKVEDKVVYDFMLENTDPAYVFFQMDVYWACMGRAYPVEYFRKYPGRFKMLHIKDHYELGESGMVGFDAIFGNAETGGLENFIVELEGFTKGDWNPSIKACADYLLGADFVKESYAK
ncbi:MAG: sugar phosphate isomerase/epimerase [Bacteroidales bacterium]|nr:sugar phosphate isomerase/epimerase [Bacteroidales bacterium]